MQPISHTPGVCGGRACVRNTRIPVWVLEKCRRLGLSTEEILEDFSTLSISDLNAALTYALEHAEEIDRDLKENDED